MRSNKSILKDRRLTQSMYLLSYFFLLTIVSPEGSVFQIVAGVLLAGALIWWIVRLIGALRSGPANGQASCAGNRLVSALIPVGFLVLAIVQIPAGSRVLPLLYFFLALAVVSGAIKLIRCE